MKCTVFLVVFATAFVAVANAKLSHNIMAALRRGQPSLGFHRRSGINPSSVAKECQPTCTSIIQKLDVRVFSFRSAVPLSSPSLRGGRGRCGTTFTLYMLCD